MTIELSSPPERSRDPAVFSHFDSATASYLLVTQECYRAEVLLKNIGSSTVAPGPYRGPMSMEIVEEGSTNWRAWNLSSLGEAPLVSPGHSLAFHLRVPISARKWRVTCSYQRWFLPHRYLNYVLRDWLKMNFQVGDQDVYEITSDVWNLPPPVN